MGRDSTGKRQSSLRRVKSGLLSRASPIGLATRPGSTPAAPAAPAAPPVPPAAPAPPAPAPGHSATGDAADTPPHCRGPHVPRPNATHRSRSRQHGGGVSRPASPRRRGRAAGGRHGQPRGGRGAGSARKPGGRSNKRCSRRCDIHKRDGPEPHPTPASHAPSNTCLPSPSYLATQSAHTHLALIAHENVVVPATHNATHDGPVRGLPPHQLGVAW